MRYRQSSSVWRHFGKPGKGAASEPAAKPPGLLCSVCQLAHQFGVPVQRGSTERGHVCQLAQPLWLKVVQGQPGTIVRCFGFSYGLQPFVYARYELFKSFKIFHVINSIFSPHLFFVFVGIMPTRQPGTYLFRVIHCPAAIVRP
jgi:hypothetical protein